MLSIFSCAYWLSVCHLWQNTPSDCLPIFLNRVGFFVVFVLLLLSYMSSSYILDITPVTDYDL